MSISIIWLSFFSAIYLLIRKFSSFLRLFSAQMQTYHMLHCKTIPNTSVRIQHSVHINNYKNLKINSRCFIGYGCVFSCFDNIDVGEGTLIASECKFYTRDHLHGQSIQLTPALYKYAPIKIGANCWIGTRVIILPGVTIGDNTIIAANAVVTKSCNSNSIYAGIPARFIRKRS